MNNSVHHQVVIVGGGTSGISVAARLLKEWFNHRDVASIAPSDTHYYQPLWTLVGGGCVSKEASGRPMKDVIPSRAHWIKDAVTSFDAQNKSIRTRDGRTIPYDWLIVSSGLQINWDRIPGLKEAINTNGVCSNYSYETIDSTWKAIREFKGGTAIFTLPTGTVKCGGARQKIMYLADDAFRRHGVRDRSTVMFCSALGNIFGNERYRTSLEQVVLRKGIDCRFREKLIGVKGDAKKADFRNIETGEVTTRRFDLLHATPPMGPPTFLATSPLADKDGWVDVNKATLQHNRFANVFALGDCSNLPTSKTAAAIRKQAPVWQRILSPQ